VSGRSHCRLLQRLDVCLHVDVRPDGLSLPHAEGRQPAPAPPLHLERPSLVLEKHVAAGAAAGIRRDLFTALSSQLLPPARSPSRAEVWLRCAEVWLRCAEVWLSCACTNNNNHAAHSNDVPVRGSLAQGRIMAMITTIVIDLRASAKLSRTTPDRTASAVGSLGLVKSATWRGVWRGRCERGRLGEGGGRSGV